MLEVGTGFHPELTGRENIFLNGAVLGMKQREIKRKFDEIVAFAEIEKFIDTPVKRYSSGMYVRLAFAVAAHLEPEILIVDEVLAVGDLDFQRKSLGKMNKVTQEEGRTVIFVSHNMDAISKICNKSILLKNGQIELFDETSKVIAKYLEKTEETNLVSLRDRTDREGKGGVVLTDIKITNQAGSTNLKSGDRLKIAVSYESKFQEAITGVRLVLIVQNDNLHRVLWLDNEVTKDGFTSVAPSGTIVCETGPLNLVAGRYVVDANFHINGVSCDLVTMAGDFQVETNPSDFNFTKQPDKTVVDYIVPYSFKQLN